MHVKVIITVIRLVSKRAAKTFKKRWSRANVNFLVCPKFRLHLSVFQLIVNRLFPGSKKSLAFKTGLSAKPILLK